MVVSTILLAQNDVYVSYDGKLPARPDFDKDLLKALVKNQIISVEAGKMLPKSIRDVAYGITGRVEPTTGITIPEIAGLTDLLLVVRSYEPLKGKKFRLNNFEQIVCLKELEIWRRK